MRIIRAAHLGMCFGVRDAIARDLIDTISGGGVVFSYYPDPVWLQTSRFLSCPASGGPEPPRRKKMSAPSPGFRVVWGVSDNTRRWFSLSEAEALGYKSADDSEVYAEEVLAASGEPPSDSPARVYLGGVWCSPEFDTAAA